MRIRNAQNMADADFLEIFFGRKCRKYAGNCSFCRFLSDFFLDLVVFSHKNIIFNNANHQAWFNCQQNWFCSRNSLKVAGTADFRRKSGISWISQAVLYIFSWNFAHWCKMAIPKIWQSPIFNQCTFPAENAGNMPEKPVFGEISSSVFTDFLFKNA